MRSPSEKSFSSMYLDTLSTLIVLSRCTLCSILICACLFSVNEARKGYPVHLHLMTMRFRRWLGSSLCLSLLSIVLQISGHSVSSLVTSCVALLTLMVGCAVLII